jgi:hypothetical protein
VDLFTLPADPCDIAATNDGLVFLAGGSGQWTDLSVVDMNTKQFTLKWTGVRMGNRLRLAPEQKHLYAAIRNVSPAGIPSDAVPPAFNPAARARQAGAVSLNANFAARGVLTVSPDGTFLLCDAGRIIRLGR